jgi:hypothetical protein
MLVPNLIFVSELRYPGSLNWVLDMFAIDDITPVANDVNNMVKLCLRLDVVVGVLVVSIIIVSLPKCAIHKYSFMLRNDRRQRLFNIICP